MNKIPILTEEQIAQKLTRMAYEIWEKNCEEEEVVLVGIEDVGTLVAENLATILRDISPLKVTMTGIVIDKNDPLSRPVTLSNEVPMDGKVVVLVDDVANSGRTLIYALKPILLHSPQKIEIAVLVDRKHKSFPIAPDIIGHSISTTIQEHIIVSYEGPRIKAAHLE